MNLWRRVKLKHWWPDGPLLSPKSVRRATRRRHHEYIRTRSLAKEKSRRHIQAQLGNIQEYYVHLLFFNSPLEAHRHPALGNFSRQRARLILMEDADLTKSFQEFANENISDWCAF